MQSLAFYSLVCPCYWFRLKAVLGSKPFRVYTHIFCPHLRWHNLKPPEITSIETFELKPGGCLHRECLCNLSKYQLRTSARNCWLAGQRKAIHLDSGEDYSSPVMNSLLKEGETELSSFKFTNHFTNICGFWHLESRLLPLERVFHIA